MICVVRLFHLMDLFNEQGIIACIYIWLKEQGKYKLVQCASLTLCMFIYYANINVVF